MDAAEHFLEDNQFRNEPLANPSTQVLRERNEQLNIFTQTLPESLGVIHELRLFVDNLTETSGDFERYKYPKEDRPRF